MVHCESGLGRTGVICYLKMLYQEFEINAQFNKVVRSLIEGKGVSDDCLNYFSDRLETLLDQLRVKRYAIQTEEQLFSAIPQFLLLCAQHLGFSQGKMSQLEKLASTLFSEKFDKFPVYTPVCVWNSQDKCLQRLIAPERFQFVESTDGLDDSAESELEVDAAASSQTANEVSVSKRARGCCLTNCVVGLFHCLRRNSHSTPVVEFKKSGDRRGSYTGNT